MKNLSHNNIYFVDMGIFDNINIFNNEVFTDYWNRYSIGRYDTLFPPLEHCNRTQYHHFGYEYKRDRFWQTRSAEHPAITNYDCVFYTIPSMGKEN